MVGVQKQWNVHAYKLIIFTKAFTRLSAKNQTREKIKRRKKKEEKERGEQKRKEKKKKNTKSSKNVETHPPSA